MRFHVLGLSPREQLALRCLLFNAFAAWMDKVVKDASSFTVEESNQKSSYTYKLFCRYNDLLDILASEETMSNAKPRCLILTADAIRLVGIAVRGFDEKSHYLASAQVNQIKSSFSSVKEKVESSAQYSYTRDEIDKAKREV